jgi:Domain of unknown function (DUF4287)
VSFNAYIENIEKITGLKPENFREKAIEADLIHDDLKASEFTKWLKEDFGLGQGHSMAMWKYFVDQNWVVAKGSKIRK